VGGAGAPLETLPPPALRKMKLARECSKILWGVEKGAKKVLTSKGWGA